MNKKIIIIVIIILVIIGLGAALFIGRNGSGENTLKGTSKGFFPNSESGNIDALPPGILGEDVLVDAKNFVLTKLSVSAVSGATYTKGKVTYVDRATGNIYEIEADGKDRNRISNTTIPKIFDARFSSDGDNFIFRYLVSDNGVESVRNFLAGLSGESGTSTALTVEGIFLPVDISSVVISPEEDKIFYIYKQGEETIGVTANFQNKKQKQIFSSSFGEWNIAWPSKNIITLLTKPSGVADGFFYSLDAKTGKFTKLLGGVKGLGATADDKGSSILYSESGQNTIKTMIYNIKKGESSVLPIATLSEKCIFSYEEDYVYCSAPGSLPTAMYPDDWYQGLISFSDLIWKINISDGNTELLAGISDNFDATNLFLSSQEDYLFFINKKDSTLWSLRLKEGV